MKAAMLFGYMKATMCKTHLNIKWTQELISTYRNAPRSLVIIAYHLKLTIILTIKLAAVKNVLIFASHFLMPKKI